MAMAEVLNDFCFHLILLSPIQFPGSSDLILTSYANQELLILVGSLPAMTGKPRPYGFNGSRNYKPDDLESAISSTRRKPRFRDIVNLTTEDQFHNELKRKLKEGVDREGLEIYRKTVKEIKGMKNKKIKSFYEKQNGSLNDWLEVDMLVSNMADEVLDSMNPRDLDGDGVAENGGALKRNGGDIEPLLPEDERENRRKGERRAKWAINVDRRIRSCRLRLNADVQ
jgi:hypothetical protein